MGPMLPQKETGVPEENLRCLVESKWTTQFSHVTMVNLIRKLHGTENRPPVVRDKYTTTVPPELHWKMRDIRIML